MYVCIYIYICIYTYTYKYLSVSCIIAFFDIPPIFMHRGHSEATRQRRRSSPPAAARPCISRPMWKIAAGM